MAGSRASDQPDELLRKPRGPTLLWVCSPRSLPARRTGAVSIRCAPGQRRSSHAGRRRFSSPPHVDQLRPPHSGAALNYSATCPGEGARAIRAARRPPALRSIFPPTRSCRSPCRPPRALQHRRALVPQFHVDQKSKLLQLIGCASTRSLVLRELAAQLGNAGPRCHEGTLPGRDLHWLSLTNGPRLSRIDTGYA